jgi:hypothetical protein
MADYLHLLRPRTGTIQREAGFLRRTGAFLFDILLLDIAITAPFASIFEHVLERAQEVGVTNLVLTGREFGAAVMVFLIAYAYFVIFEYVLGQTPGMMLARTSVKGARRLWPHLVRNSFLIPIFPFVLFWIIEPFAILFYRRGVLEYVSSTRTLYQHEVLV